MKILRILLLTLLVFCASFNVYTFTKIRTSGLVIFIEPNLAILTAEIILASLITVGGLVWLIKMIRNLRNER